MRIVVLTCDKYIWLVPLFLHFYKKYWPDSPYGVDIITENEKVQVNLPRIPIWYFYTEGVSWSSGILNYLKQSDDDKFLLTPEDYVIKSPVSTARIKLAERLCTGNVGCVRLNAPDKYYKHTVDSGIKYFKEYPLDKPYSMSMQAAIWQKKYLFDVLRDKEDAWEAELNGSKRLAKLKSKWRVLWPKSAIIDYQAGGFMVAGRPRMDVVKWTLLDLVKEA